jgi:hypothetical protein
MNKEYNPFHPFHPCPTCQLQVPTEWAIERKIYAPQPLPQPPPPLPSPPSPQEEDEENEEVHIPTCMESLKRLFLRIVYLFI